MAFVENIKNNTIKRFITCSVPSTVCNLKCSYCYIRQIKRNDMCTNRFVLPGLKLAELLTPQRLGGICYFNLCADGETLLHPDVIDLIDGLTIQGHYVDITTNGTISKKFDELIKRLNDTQQKHMFVKFSFHYLELLRTDLMNEFINNVNKIKNSLISYTIEITPHDELIKYIDEIKTISLSKFGALPHITVARDENTKNIELLTNFQREKYAQIWGQFDSKLFDFKLRIFNEKRKEFCYAGDWSLKLDLETGKYRQCYRGCELGNICDEGAIHFKAIGCCPLPHCFNGHAFLALGNIPGLQVPTYSDERNRIMKDGDNWLKQDCAKFFSTKLYESNEQYSSIKKGYYIINSIYSRIINKLKLIIKNEK